jgi:hypothetical protein
MISPAKRWQDLSTGRRLCDRVFSHGERSLPSHPQLARGCRSYIGQHQRQPARETESRLDELASFFQPHPILPLPMRWISFARNSIQTGSPPFLRVVTAVIWTTPTPALLPQLHLGVVEQRLPHSDARVHNDARQCLFRASRISSSAIDCCGCCSVFILTYLGTIPGNIAITQPQRCSHPCGALRIAVANFHAANCLFASFGVTSFNSPVDKSRTNPRITTFEGIHGCDLSFSTCFCVCQFTSE